LFNNFFENKRILVTGHTGFKGAWLTLWLKQMGAQVFGYSKDVPTIPALYSLLNVGALLDKEYMCDLIDLRALSDCIINEKPDLIFHLAAQPILSTSYQEPIETIQSNTIGTTNLMQCLTKIQHDCTVVLITSDKVYRNVEQVWGYREIDQLGGKDIYSASKAAAEIIIDGYYHSFLKNNKFVKFSVARAGNVIGGGDWAKDRIVVDCMRAWSKDEQVEIRRPYATRPWQHVLEPLSGYLLLAKRLFEADSDELMGQAFNFGPNMDCSKTVLELLEGLAKSWDVKGNQAFIYDEKAEKYDEAGLLKLCCDKALLQLDWKATLDYHETITYTSEWYYQFYKKNACPNLLTMQQIESYTQLAMSRGLAWMV
jgi:CDP-glucose 4,6-dehydratase